jgi:hypothetical protein
MNIKKLSSHHKYLPFPLAALTAGLLMTALNVAHADSSIGIDPYAEGFGFDRPNDAAWGGWTRCAPGTLYAEWDIFDDASHGAVDDLTAAPNAANESVASCGATTAWLGWSTSAENPGFAYNKGQYIYNLSNGGQGGPTSFRVDVAGNLAPGLTRAVLQIETRSYPIPEETLRLNGLKPTLVGNKFEQETTINGRPAKVYHQLVVWNLNSAPEALLFDFESKAHTVLHMVAVDVGPLGGETGGGDGEESPSAKIFLNLPAEDLAPAWVQSLHGQRPTYFPAEWKPSQLLYKKSTNKAGTKVTQSLKGGIKALFNDEATGGASNRVFVDIYRKDPIADIVIATCELKATQKRRWAKVNVDNQLVKLGTARYVLDIAETEFPESPDKDKLTKDIGGCDVDMDADGVQLGVPELQEGDYTRFRRLVD